MKIFSFDAETDGLWGKPFAIAAIVYEEKLGIQKSTYRTLSGAEMAAKYGPTHNLPREQVCENIVEHPRLVEVARFVARCRADIQNQWVMANVVPAITDIDVTHASYKDMLLDFSLFYMEHHGGADCVVHMGYVVEAGLLRDMWQHGFIGDFDGPYPLYDVSGNLQQSGEDPTSVDAYAKKHGLKIGDYGTTHHPLYDCEVAAKAYYHLKNK